MCQVTVLLPSVTYLLSGSSVCSRHLPTAGTRGLEVARTFTETAHCSVLVFSTVVLVLPDLYVAESLLFDRDFNSEHDKIMIYFSSGSTNIRPLK